MPTIGYPTIKFYNPDLLVDVAQANLLSDVTAAGMTLSVDSITGIGVGDYLLIGEFGHETSEIVRVHTATTPSGTTITLNAACTYDHSRDERLYRIDRDQVEFSRATTLTGSKSVLATSNIATDSQYTVYEDITNTTGYGFTRAKNSADSTYSNYSESFPYAGYSEQSLKKIFDSVLVSLGMVDDLGQPIWTSKISRDAAFQAVVDCQDLIARKRYRWSYLTNFDVVISELATGEDTYALPDRIAREDGQASILALRIGGRRDMTYVDKRKFNRLRQNVVKTTLASAISSTSDVTITLTDSSDFGNSGNIQVVVDDQDAIDSIAYTANDKGTNVVSGVTGILETVSNGANVWQGASFNEPTTFTTYEDEVKLNPVPSEDWEDYNLIGDIYEKPTVVNDLADEAQFPATVIKPYLKHALELLKYDGDESKSDASYKRFLERLSDLENAENNGQRFSFSPGRRPTTTTNLKTRVPADVVFGDDDD